MSDKAPDSADEHTGNAGRDPATRRLDRLRINPEDRNEDNGGTEQGPPMPRPYDRACEQEVMPRCDKAKHLAQPGASHPPCLVCGGECLQTQAENEGLESYSGH